MIGPPMLDVVLAGSTVRAMGPEFRRIMGIDGTTTGVPASLLEFGRQPADEAWVFKCVHLKAMAAQSVPLRVEIRDGREWVPIEAKSDSAGEDLQFLLDDVNPAWEGAQLQAYTSAGGSVHGGSYWLMVKGKYGGQPQELHWLSGALVTPVMGRSFPEQYEYLPTTGSPVRYDADVVIPFRDTVNLADPYALLSPLSSARFEISTNKQAAEWNDALLRNWGIPAGVWTTDPAADIGPQDRSLIKRALRALRGPSNQGRQPVLPGGLKWNQLSMTQKDADWIATRKVSRMTISAVLGVPLVLAGDDEKASVYASTRDAERVFWRQTMINELDHRAVPINAYLVPLFDPSRKKLRVAYDYTGVEALRGAPTEEMAQWLAYVQAGLPLNRAIKQFGMGDPVEGGDEPFKAQKQAEAIAEKQAEAKPDEPRPEEYDTPKKSGAEPPPGGERVRALGRGLYKHPTIRRFLETGEMADMERIVAPEELEAFTTGLRRRYSVKQLLDGDPVRGYPGLANLEPPTRLVVPEPDPAIRELRESLDKLAAEVRRPRKLRRIAKRDKDGRIIAVDEVEIQ